MENSTDIKSTTNREGLSQVGKDLRADAHSAIDKTADKVPAATDRVANGAHRGVDKVADTVETLSSQVASRSKQLAETYKNFAESGRSHVRASPAISVLLAVAAGYGLSKLIGSRHPK